MSVAAQHQPNARSHRRTVRLLAWCAAILCGLCAVWPLRAGPIVPQLPTLPPISTEAEGFLRAVVPDGSLRPVTSERDFVGLGGGSQSLFAEVHAEATFLAENVRNPFTGEIETFPSGGNAQSMAQGGMRPTLRVSGTVFGLGEAGANAFLNYGFSVVPLNPQIQGTGPVPVVFHTTGYGRITAGTPFTDGSVRGEVRVNGAPIGFFFATAQGPPDTFGGPTVLPAFVTNSVEMTLIGSVSGHNLSSGTSGFEGFVDPIIYVDPDATFQHNGETLRYIEHYGIAYSPGIEQWQPTGAPVPEPGAVALVLTGVLGILAGCRRTPGGPDARRPGCPYPLTRAERWEESA